MLNKTVFLKGINMLGELWQREITDTQLDLYFAVLKHVADEDFEAGIMRLISTEKSTEFPLPAKIRDACAGGNLETVAQRAVMMIEQAWSSGIDYNNNIDFRDNVLHYVINLAGGWIAICEKSEKEWRFLRKDLMRDYKAVLESGKQLQDQGILWGIHGSKENIDLLRQRGLQPKIITFDKRGRVHLLAHNKYQQLISNNQKQIEGEKE